MTILEVALLSLLTILGLIAIVEDLRTGLIKNKIILFFLCAGLILDIIYYGFYATDLVLSAVCNILIITAVCLLLFYTHSFAGGDCKLAIAMAVLYPAQYYIFYGKSDLTLIFVLAVSIFFGYIYLLVTSGLALITRKTAITKEDFLESIRSFFVAFAAASCYIGLISLTVYYLEIKSIYINIWVTRIVCMGCAWVTGKVKFFKKIWLLVVAFLLM